MHLCKLLIDFLILLSIKYDLMRSEHLTLVVDQGTEQELSQHKYDGKDSRSMFNAKERSDSNRITGVWSINQSKNRNKEAKKQMKIEELERIIQEHKEDLEFHLLLLQEFGKIEKNTRRGRSSDRDKVNRF